MTDDKSFEDLISKSQDTKKKHLTFKQKRFVNELVQGKHPTDAAELAFDTSNRESARQIGLKYMQKDKIKLALEEAAPLAFQTIEELMRDGKSESTRLKAALETLDRAGYGAVKKTQTENLNVNIDSTINELNERN